MTRLRRVADHSGQRNVWFASPTGDAGNSGTKASPWDLPTALSSGSIQPGDQVRLLAGTYGSGETIYTASIAGTTTKRILVAPWAKDRVLIRGAIKDGGSSGYLDIRNLELAQTPTDRAFEYAERLNHPFGIEILTPGWRIHNCIISNCIRSGIWLSGEGTDTLISGCLIYNTGFYDDTNGNTYSSHGFYTHNDTGGQVRIVNNVMASAFDLGGQLFSSGSNSVQDYEINGCVFLENFSVGSGKQVRNIRFVNNRGIGPLQFQFVTSDVDSTDIVIRGNYLQNIGGSGYLLRWVDDLTFESNTTATDFWLGWSETRYDTLPSDYSWTFRNNTYTQETLNIGETYYGWRIDGESTQTFANWRTQSALDATSTYATGTPSANVYDFRLNPASNDTGILTIHNHTGSDQVVIDTSAWGLVSGAHYELRQAQDPINDFFEFDYDAGNITIDMRSENHGVAKPEAWGIDIEADGTVVSSTFPDGAAYLLFRRDDSVTVTTAAALQDALDGTTVIKPGQTIFLDAGTYTQAGGFNCTVAGTEHAKIVVRPSAGAEGSVIINGGLHVHTGGAHFRFQDLEVREDSWTTRWTSESGSNPTDFAGILGAGIKTQGDGCQIINCWLHDNRQGLSPQSTGFREFIYGCLINNNGWDAPDRGHGHGIYLQGGLPGWKVVENVLAVKGFSTLALNFYGSTADLQNVLVKRMAGVGGINSDNYSFLVGGEVNTDVANVLMEECHSYEEIFGQRFLIGFDAGANNTSLTMSDCYSGQATLERGIWPVGQPDYGNLSITNRSLDQVFVWPNRFNPNRAHCIVYNAAEANTVNVDVSTLGWTSGTVTYHNAQDYNVDTATDTIASDQIQVDMQAVSHTVAVPTAHDYTDSGGSGHFTKNELSDTTFPKFGAFVLVKS